MSSPCADGSGHSPVGSIVVGSINGKSRQGTRGAAGALSAGGGSAVSALPAKGGLCAARRWLPSVMPNCFNLLLGCSFLPSFSVSLEILSGAWITFRFCRIVVLSAFRIVFIQNPASPWLRSNALLPARRRWQAVSGGWYYPRSGNAKASMRSGCALAIRSDYWPNCCSISTLWRHRDGQSIANNNSG